MKLLQRVHTYLFIQCNTDNEQQGIKQKEYKKIQYKKNTIPLREEEKRQKNCRPPSLEPENKINGHSSSSMSIYCPVVIRYSTRHSRTALDVAIIPVRINHGRSFLRC